jgi:hypothetical protein
MPVKRRGEGGMWLTSMRAAVMKEAQPTAMTSRPAVKPARLPARPHTTAPSPNSRPAACTSRRQPSCSTSRRCSAIMPMATTAYSVATMLNSSGLAAMSPMMGAALKATMPVCRKSLKGRLAISPYSRCLGCGRGKAEVAAAGFMAWRAAAA